MSTPKTTSRGRVAEWQVIMLLPQTPMSFVGIAISRIPIPATAMLMPALISSEKKNATMPSTAMRIPIPISACLVYWQCIFISAGQTGKMTVGAKRIKIPKTTNNIETATLFFIMSSKFKSYIQARDGHLPDRTYREVSVLEQGTPRRLCFWDVVCSHRLFH